MNGAEPPAGPRPTPIVGLLAASDADARACAAALSQCGGSVRRIDLRGMRSPALELQPVDALIVCGAVHDDGGNDADGANSGAADGAYGGAVHDADCGDGGVSAARGSDGAGGDADSASAPGEGVGASDARSADEAHALALIRAALDDDMPILAVGVGMLALNAALGGKPPKPAHAHAAIRAASGGNAANDSGGNGDGDSNGGSDNGGNGDDSGVGASARHQIYIAPGSRLAAVVGSGGFVSVNSRHARAVSEAQKSPRLIASAYALDDGVIEALESPRHRWVIGVQFQPERRMELPPHFHRLFQSLAERAAERMAPRDCGQ